jgi:hypothetical protein
MTAAAELKDLDWTEITCQCSEHGGCTLQAKFAVHIHAVDRCNDPGLLSGDRVVLRCRACVMSLRRCVERSLQQLNRDGLACCDGCGAPLVEVTDVVREVVRL